MKYKVKIILSLVVLTLLSGWTKAHGQELTSEFSDFHSDTSIIRNQREGVYLIYSSKYPKSTFIQIDESSPSTTSTVLQLNDYIYIKDFHIYGDMVYFCGFEVTGQGAEAIVGYFNIAYFPTCQVYYYIYPYAMSFNKLDIYEIPYSPYERHVVMTGSVSSTVGCIVDAYPTSPTQWNFVRSDMLHNTYIFDDVEARDTNIAFSARTVDSTGNPVGEIWFFTKPMVAGTTILMTNLHKKIINFPAPTSPIWMEKCPNDNLAITYGTMNENHVIVTSMNDVVNRPVLLEFREKWIAKDIKYNVFSKELEVLVTEFPYDQTLERIFQFPYTFFVGTFLGGYSYCHEYRVDIDRLCSFDNTFSRGDNFIVSGFETVRNNMCFYKYAYNFWGECTNNPREFVMPIAFSGMITSFDLPMLFPVVQTRVEMNTKEFDIEYVKKCQ